jgi:hypothetical protein
MAITALHTNYSRSDLSSSQLSLTTLHLTPCDRGLLGGLALSRSPFSSTLINRESLAIGDARMSQADVDTWQMAQVQTMLDLFAEARGRAPASKEELAHFLDEEHAAGRIPDGPILPTTGALLKIAKYGRLT